MSMKLQNLFIQPRNKSDSRFARESYSKRTLDPDHPTIAYNLIDKQDYNKFRILKDDEVELERMKSYELAKKLVSTWKGRPVTAPTESISRSSSRQKFIPPKLGTMSSTARKEAKVWEKTVSAVKGNSRPNSVNPRYANTIRKLAENSTNQLESKDLKEKDIVVPILSRDKATDVDIFKVVEVMKTKYIQNIQVIDKLYDEKKSMEKRIELLEKQVRRITKNGGESQDFDEWKKDEDDHDEISKPLDEEKSDSRSNPDHPLHGDNMTMSAEDIAKFLDEDMTSILPKKDSHYHENQSHDHTKRSVSTRPMSAISMNRSITGTSQRNSSPYLKPRPSSARTFSISPNLQADVDKYNQRMEMIRLKDLEKERLQKEYELIQKEKLLRASASSSSDIERMLERQAILKETSQKKRELLQKKLQEEKELEELERRRKRREQLEKPVIKHDTDWKDYETMEEVKRKQRIEQRKQELLMSMSASSVGGIFDTTGRGNTTMSSRPGSAMVRSPSNRSNAANEHYKPFKATEDPEKIAEKLARRQQAWEEKLSRTKENIRSSLSERQSSSTNVLTLVKSMQDRHEFYDKKRQDRKLERKKREEDEKQRKIEEEKKKREKLFNAKIPDTGRRLTNAAELRAMKVREQLEKDAEMERLKKLQDEKKARASRETSAVVKTIIEQREYERKQKVSGFVELSQVSDIAAQKAAEKRKDMREKLRKQRQDLEAVKNKQPSLIERYEQQQAKKTGQQDALQKIATAAGAGAGYTESNSSRNGNRKQEDDNFDIFSEKEKLLLQL